MGRAILVVGMYRPRKLIGGSSLVGMARHPFILPLACIHDIRWNEARDGCPTRF